MDTYAPEFYMIKDFKFSPSKYTEYEGGKLKSSGDTQLKILVSSISDRFQNGYFKVLLLGNDISIKINSLFDFDRCLGCGERLLLYSLPKATNANILVLYTLRSVSDYTRGSKIYSGIEPVVGSIFTENGIVVKMSFTMSNPERLIEFQ